MSTPQTLAVARNSCGYDLDLNERTEEFKTVRYKRRRRVHSRLKEQVMLVMKLSLVPYSRVKTDVPHWFMGRQRRNSGRLMLVSSQLRRPL